MYPTCHKALGDDLVVLLLPDFENGPKTGQGSWAWGIGAGTKNDKAADSFLDYLPDQHAVLVARPVELRAFGDAAAADPDQARYACSTRWSTNSAPHQ